MAGVSNLRVRPQLKKQVPAALPPDFPMPCQAQSMRLGIWRGSPGGGAGRAPFQRPAKPGPWGAAGRAGPGRARGADF